MASVLSYRERGVRAPVSCPATATTAITPAWALTCDDSYAMAVQVTHESTTVAIAITAKLQECMTPNGTFTDVPGVGSSAAITGASGTALIRFEAVESSTYAMLPFVRVVVVTGAGDSTTITSVIGTVRN
jgi:hypothetical protein